MATKKVYACNNAYTMVSLVQKLKVFSFKFQVHMMFTACLASALPKPERSNRSSGLIRNSYSYLLNKQIIIDNSRLGLANTQDERLTSFWGSQDQRE
jgi:hypothetical protein